MELSLKELYKIFVDNVEDINLKRETNNNTGNYYYSGILNAKKALFNIKETGLFSSFFTNPYIKSLLESGGDRLVYKTAAEAAPLSVVLSELHNKIKTIIDFITDTQKPNFDHENSIYVYISKNIDSLKLEKTLKDLNIILNTVFTADKDAKAQIITVEKGSIKIEINLNTAKALMLVSALTYSGTMIYKNIYESEVAKEKAKAAGLNTQSIKNLVQSQEQLLNILVETEATMLYNEYYNKINNKKNETSNTDGEQIERLKHSIKLVSDLISQGTKIYPAIQTTEEDKKLFPDYNLLLLDKHPKKIEKNNNSTE